MRDARLLCAGLSGGHRLPGRDPPLLLGRRGDAIRRGPAGRLLLRGARPDAIAAQRAGGGESGLRIVARHARLLPDAVRDRRAHHARAPRRPGARRCAARPLVPHRLRGVRRAAAGGHAALPRAVAPGAPRRCRSDRVRTCSCTRASTSTARTTTWRSRRPERGRWSGCCSRSTTSPAGGTARATTWCSSTASRGRRRFTGPARRRSSAPARAPSASSRRPITGSICSSRPTTPG